MARTIQDIIDNIGSAFNSDERETSILYDYNEKVVVLETTEPYTARRWYRTFKDSESAVFDTKSDSLRLTVPFDYCRKAEFVIKAKHRKIED